MLQLDEVDNVNKRETDIRETPIPGGFENFYVTSSILQDIDVGDGWTDITGLTKTFNLTRNKKVIIMASVSGQPGDDAHDFGFSIRIVIDGVAQSNSVRTYRFHAFAFDDPNELDILTDGTTTTIPMHTQHVATLDVAAGHTIKIQASAITDGTTYGVRFAAERSLSILAF